MEIEFEEEGLKFFVARCIHAFVAKHKIPEDATIRVMMKPVAIGNEDYDIDDLDVTYKIFEHIKIVIEM